MEWKSCSFTGHRPREFPWPYNEADARCIALKKALAEKSANLVDVYHIEPKYDNAPPKMFVTYANISPIFLQNMVQ